MNIPSSPEQRIPSEIKLPQKNQMKSQSISGLTHSLVRWVICSILVLDFNKYWHKFEIYTTLRLVHTTSQHSCYQDFCVIPNHAAKTELNDR
ncbi:hypothetical protein T01_1423 [Trichinella spiralis]|uniref:Uncharacterized protein n=1 Tax=Trichinella spiralis TaxID=6334 RepID=A0A0V1BQ47_TRISP|nr:hypothetical protein T01_1423 [Trichinella spiralis]